MDGILIINKEKGWTSNDVVQKIKGISHEKIGHTGTLDPLATGVLPILVGKGTLLSSYLTNHDKEYITTIQLGEKTITADLEGEVIEQKEVTKEMLQKEKIEKVLQSLIGKQSQVPPIYSAIKVKGKKLYEYARKGQEVERKPREIYVYQLELMDILEEEQEIICKVNCSKGTYIRSLAEEIATRLGTVGFVKELKRTRVGEFKIDQASKISDLEKDFEKDLITIEDFFKDKKEIQFEKEDLTKFVNGVKINGNWENGYYRIYQENSKFVGVGTVENRQLKRWIVL